MDAPEIAVEKSTLANGLTLLVAPEHYASVASIQVWCETGSVHEAEWVGGGLTHLLEHMLFKGTAKRSAKQINDEIHQVGGYLNAYTSFDRTVFWVDCPAAAVSTALDLAADMLFQSVIDEQEMSREMEVIRREFDLGYDDPDRMLSHLTFATAYQAHPCRYPVIGLRRIFDQIDSETLLAYYRRRYVPENVFVVVAGDVDVAQVQEWVQKFFGPIPARPVGPVVIPAEPPQVGRRDEVESFETAIGYFNLAWHVPPVFHEDVPALDVLSILLGGGASSFLFEEVREKLGSVHSIGAYSFTPAFPGLLTVSGTCPIENVDGIDEIVLTKLGAWRKQGSGADALAKAKRIVWVSALEQLQTVRGIASDIGLNWLYTRNLRFNQRYLKRVETVSHEQVHEVFDRYLTEDNLNVVALRPKTSTQLPVMRSPAEKKNQVRVLPNGVPVVLIPDERLPLLHGTLVCAGGVLAEPPKRGGLGRFYTQCLLKGTAKKSAQEIADAIESLGGSLFGDSGYNSFRFGFSSLSDDFGRVLPLVTEILSGPTFPEEAIERERTSQIAAIDADDLQSGVIARHTLRGAIYGSHPYSANPLGTKASVANIERTDLIQLHEWVKTSSAWVLGICGHFDERKLWEELCQTIGSLPQRPARYSFDMPAVKPFATQTIVQRNDRHQAFVTVGYLACTLSDPDRVGFEALDEAAGDASSRFFVKLREELGLAYSVGTSLALGLSPGLFTLYAATAPETADDVAKLYHEEIDVLAAEGLSQEEFERSKKKLLAQIGFQKQNLESYCHSLALNQLYGFSLDYFDQRQRQIEQMTAQDVLGVCHKYLMDKPATTVIVKA
ncbi:MAG: insulinase family protein [Verrucomicrobia bacterium]|nr:insulinase family protein [Verrucomicrobiota bacterium]